MSSVTIYASVPLRREKEEIRLLKLWSGSESDALGHSLQSFPLNNCPPFSALSYAWGDPPASHQILVNQKPFHIRDNLWEFLVQARREESSGSLTARYLWIDAICIDQESVLERNHQVELMRKIYSQVSDC